MESHEWERAYVLGHGAVDLGDDGQVAVVAEGAVDGDGALTDGGKGRGGGVVKGGCSRCLLGLWVGLVGRLRSCDVGTWLRSTSSDGGSFL